MEGFTLKNHGKLFGHKRGAVQVGDLLQKNNVVKRSH